jgi:hypothetical protein
MDRATLNFIKGLPLIRFYLDEIRSPRRLKYNPPNAGFGRNQSCIRFVQRHFLHFGLVVL